MRMSTCGATAWHVLVLHEVGHNNKELQMGRTLIKLTHDKKDYYLEWSSIVDAPITWGMSLEELKKYIKDKYGNEGLRELSYRLERLDLENNHRIEGIISYNRSGKNETKMTIKEIINKYCIERKD